MKKLKIISSILLLMLYSGIALGQTEFSGNHNTLNNPSGTANTNGILTNTSIGVFTGNATMTGVSNSFVGANSGSNSTSGSFNTAMGNFSLNNNTQGSNNSAFGFEALRNTTLGGQNTAFGASAGFTNTTNSFNSYFGFEAGKFSVGSFNCFLGHTAGAIHWGANPHDRNTAVGEMAGVTISGDDNAFLGFSAGNFGMGNRNVAIGSLAMPSCILGSDENVVIGFRAASATPNAPTMNNSVVIGAFSNFWNFTGTNNTLVGHRSGFNLSGGSDNSTLGINTAINLVGGNDNTFIGADADATNTSSTLTNAASIGANAKVTNSNHMILGDNNVNVGIGLSTDPIGPQNKLEINTALNGLLAVPAGNVGLSGLRLRDLHSGTTPIANPGPGVLAVDANGDVIYVPGAGVGTVTGAHNGTSMSTITPNFVAFGQDPLQAGNPGQLLNNREVPMNGFNTYFTGQSIVSTSTNNNSIAIGFATTAVLPGKFAVLQQTGTASTTAGFVSRSIAGVNLDPSGALNQLMVGVGGLSNFQDPNWIVNRPNHIGGRFQASGGQFNYGVYGTASQVGGTGTQFYGGYFESNPVSAGTLNYGVYGRSLPAPGNGLGPNWAGFFDGDLVSTSFVGISDKNLKRDIKQVEKGIDIINQLNPVSYYFDVENHKDIGLNYKMQYGFISQEVKEILPDLTSPIIYPSLFDSSGKEIRKQQEYLGLNYDGFIAILTKGIQEQQQVISNQANQIDNLQQQIDELKALVSGTGNSNTNSQQNITLTDKDVVVLNQNVPNPFAEQTTINYNIPENTGYAQILFYSMNGQLIKIVEITEKGEGRLNVFAGDLSSGIYTYTLIIDGKTIESKKMTKL